MSVGTGADASTKVDVTTSSQTIGKPLVGSSAFQLASLGNVWVCVDGNNVPNEGTITSTKNGSIEKLKNQFVPNTKFSNWSFWKRKGYKCLKVNIDFSQIK